MARPRTKGDPIHIRLTENDHARYTAHAEKADVSLAFYITNILAGALQFLDGTLTGVRADVVRDQLTAPVGVARMRERAERLEAGQAKTVRVGDALGVTGVLYEEPTVEERREALDEMAAATAPLGIDYGLEAKPGGLGASVSAAIHDQLDRVLAGEGLRLAPRDDLEEKVAGAGPYEDGSAWAPSDHEATVIHVQYVNESDPTVIPYPLVATRGGLKYPMPEPPTTEVCQHPKTARKTTAAGMMICSCGMVKGPDGTWRTP